MPNPIRGDMTARARWYLTIAATRHFLTAFFCIFAADSFQSSSFRPIISAAPLWAWGLAFTGAAVACAFAALNKSVSVARLGLTWSATSTLIVAFGLLIAWYTGDLSSPTGPIVWFALALKDFTVCADPMRSPFEALAQRIEDEDGDRSSGGGDGWISKDGRL